MLCCRWPRDYRPGDRGQYPLPQGGQLSGQTASSSSVAARATSGASYFSASGPWLPRWPAWRHESEAACLPAPESGFEGFGFVLRRIMPIPGRARHRFHQVNKGPYLLAEVIHQDQVDAELFSDSLDAVLPAFAILCESSARLIIGNAMARQFDARTSFRANITVSLPQHLPLGRADFHQAVGRFAGGA